MKNAINMELDEWLLPTELIRQEEVQEDKKKKVAKLHCNMMVDEERAFRICEKAR